MKIIQWNFTGGSPIRNEIHYLHDAQSFLSKYFSYFVHLDNLIQSEKEFKLHTEYSTDLGAYFICYKF